MTRVLFVDDEAIVLRTLDRAIRVRKPSWTASFAGSGSDALAALEREPFDVIVSDLSMPGMDGIKLLDRVRLAHPQITRLILSGQVRFEDLIRGGSSIHQWLAKPCPVPELIAIIDRVRWARALVDDPQLRALACGVASLPSAPALHVAVTRALQHNAGIAEICDLIVEDAAFSSKLLQLVNSSLPPDVERIMSARRAATGLGRTRLEELLLAAPLFHPAPHATETAAHCFEVATIARAVATKHHDEAYLAGLLHGIGALVLGSEHTASPVLQARVGGLLAGTWGFPSAVVAAIAFHQDPESAPDPSDSTLCAVARACALADDQPRSASGNVGM